MSNNESSNHTEEIQKIVEKLQDYSDRFYIGEQSDAHGWTLTLKEKEGPRIIVITKPDQSNVFLIRSTEEWHDFLNRKQLRHIYSKENIKNISDLIKEVGEVIMGKDIASKYLHPEEETTKDE